MTEKKINRYKNAARSKALPARLTAALLLAALVSGSAAALPAYAADTAGYTTGYFAGSAETASDESMDADASAYETDAESGDTEQTEAEQEGAGSSGSVQSDAEQSDDLQAGESTDVNESGSVDIIQDSIVIARKDSAALELYSYPSDGLIWTSSKPSVAEVSQDGTVTGRSVGTAVIRCESAADGEQYDSCSVTVKLGNSEAVFLAHKGYSGIAPENTLPAIREAVRAGFDGVELDVYELKKEKRRKYKPFILISHDNTLKRLTGKKGKIDRLTHKNYKKYKIRYHVNGIKKYGVQTFPTIEQAMKTAWREADKAGKKNFIIELDIKQKTISKSAVKKIIRLAGKRRVRINSSHYQVIRKFKKYRKYKTTELWMFKDKKTVAQRKAFINQAKKLKVKGVSMPPECWNSSLIKYAKKKHLKLATRTNSPAQAQKLIDKGFERVCTGKKIFTD